jgi:hypothetical protein
MKKFSSLLTATLFASGITTAAFAADQAGSMAPGSSSHSATEKSSSHSMTGSSSPESRTGGSTAAGDFQGQHTMSGTIEDIDPSSGTLSLKTSDGKTLSLHFPPDAIKDYKEGDQVSVQLAIAKRGGAPSATGSSPSMGSSTETTR